jgi:hypothetical protein
VLGDVTSWLINKAQVPQNRVINLASNRTPEVKKLYYEVCREAYLRTMFADYRRARNITNEQRKKREEEMRKKYNITNEVLFSWPKIFEVVPPEAEPSIPVGTYEHMVKYEQFKKYQKEIEEIDVLVDNQLLIDIKTEKTWRCTACDITFNTNLGAMARHAETHKKGNEPIKIYKTRSVREGVEGVLRPQEHQWNGTTYKWYEGSDAYLEEIRMPESLLTREGEDIFLVCEKCKKYKKKHNPTTPVRGRAVQIGKFMSHRANCAGTENQVEPSQN